MNRHHLLTSHASLGITIRRLIAVLSLHHTASLRSGRPALRLPLSSTTLFAMTRGPTSAFCLQIRSLFYSLSTTQAVHLHSDRSQHSEVSPSCPNSTRTSDPHSSVGSFENYAGELGYCRQCRLPIVADAVVVNTSLSNPSTLRSQASLDRSHQFHRATLMLSILPFELTLLSSPDRSLVLPRSLGLNLRRHQERVTAPSALSCPTAPSEHTSLLAHRARADPYTDL